MGHAILYFTIFGVKNVYALFRGINQALFTLHFDVMSQRNF